MGHLMDGVHAGIGAAGAGEPRSSPEKRVTAASIAP